MKNFTRSLITILSLSLFLANGCGTKKEGNKMGFLGLSVHLQRLVDTKGYFNPGDY